jgi:hypothetical protein
VSASIAFCSVGVAFSANLAVDGIMESVFTDVSGATVNYSHRTGRKYSLVEAQVLGMLYNWHVLQPSILTVVVIGCATFTFAGFVNSLLLIRIARIDLLPRVVGSCANTAITFKAGK